jgi:hypothetical protein
MPSGPVWGFVWLAAAWCATTALTLQADPAPTFEDALQAARSYSIQHHDPASVAEGLHRYETVVNGFSDHPRAAEAKLLFYDALVAVGDPASLIRAGNIIGALVKSTDLSTAQGRPIGERYVEFHTGSGAGSPVQDLPGATDVSERLVRSAVEAQDRPAELRSRRLRGKVAYIDGNHGRALDLHLETLELAFDWGQEGYWRQLWKHDRNQHRRCSVALTNTAGDIAGILERTGDSNLAARVKTHARLLELYPVLRRALADFKAKPQEEIAQEDNLDAHLDNTVRSFTADPSPAPPAPADRAPAVAIAPVQNSAPAPTNAPAGRWLWPIAGCAVVASAALVWFARRGRSDRGAGTT